MNQTTIANPIQCSGIGLHSGKMVTLTLRPAPEDSGIRFYAVPADEAEATSSQPRSIEPSPHSVIATGLATTLGGEGISISTVEHLLAALRGLSIDNLRIDVQGGELPIMDGSAAPFVLLLRNAGIKTLSAPRKVWRVTRPFTHKNGEKSISAKPYAGFKVEYTIDFPHPAIGRQHMELEITPQTFSTISKARTFGFLRDVEAMNERGLALGGSLDNSIVLDEHRVINEEGLRFADEFVRHKILDFVGDMAMLELPLQGHFKVHCSGHALNNQFLRTLAENSDIYMEKVTLRDETEAEATRNGHKAQQTVPAATNAPGDLAGISGQRKKPALAL